MSAEAVTAAPPTQRLDFGRRLLAFLRQYAIVPAVAALLIALTLLSDVFLTSTNLLNILDQWAPVGIMAVGGTLVIVAGGFDFSIGAIFSIAGVVAVMVAKATSPELGLLAGAGVGVAWGLANGLAVSLGRVSPFIATLATSTIIGGVSLIITGGKLVSGPPPEFMNLGQGELFGINYSIYLFAAFALACGFLLQRTIYGRRVFASGGNPEAARMSGVRVGFVRASTFVISGLSAGIAGTLVASRVGTANGQVDLTQPLVVVSAIVVGGTSIFGGEGAIWRSVLGVAFFALIGNGFNLLNFDPLYQQLVQGSILLAVVTLDGWFRGRR